jgi:NTE family protein
MNATTSLSDIKFTLVLGGGGLKGLAHVGALTVLEELNAHPLEVVGSSIGSLVGACWCAGNDAADLRQLALQLTKRDLFRVAHRDMALRRMLSPALYRQEPLMRLITGLFGDMTFDDLERPLIVNTVDLNTGQQVFWGSNGLTHVRVADAVYASCALPGYLPPIEIEGRYYVDGAAVQNLPVGFARLHRRDLVLAIDVGASTVLRSEVHRQGFAAVYARSIEIAIDTMRSHTLSTWTTPPLVLLRPTVEHIGLFSFRHNKELIEEGYRCAQEGLQDASQLPPPGASGVYPRRRVRVRVDRDRCIGCGACIVHAPPGTLALDAQGKAQVLQEEQIWSPVDGMYVHQCPTAAIIARS